MKLTKKEAKRLSILKWEFIIANGGSYEKDELPTELLNIRSYCGFCEKYNKPKANGTYGCGKCPLIVDAYTCFDTGHPFSVWDYEQTVENAQAMLDLILKT